MLGLTLPFCTRVQGMCCVSRLPNRDALVMHAFKSMLRIKLETKRLDGNLIRS